MSLVNGPFSVTLSWEVPSDNGGTRQPLSYTVRVINETVNLSFNTTLTQMTLTMDDGIWHSSMYTVTVVAENEYGVSPPAASTFTTPDSCGYMSCHSYIFIARYTSVCLLCSSYH